MRSLAWLGYNALSIKDKLSAGPVSVAIGSTNPAKVEAVCLAIEQVWLGARLLPLAVDSGVGEAPRSNAVGLALAPFVRPALYERGE